MSRIDAKKAAAIKSTAMKAVPKQEAEPVLEVGVTSSANYIGDSLLALDGAIVRLIEKLGPILTPADPQPGEDVVDEALRVSDMTALLDGYARTVQELTSVVRTLTRRVEL